MGPPLSVGGKWLGTRCNLDCYTAAVQHCTSLHAVLSITSKPWAEACLPAPGISTLRCPNVTVRTLLR